MHTMQRVWQVRPSREVVAARVVVSCPLEEKDSPKSAKQVGSRCRRRIGHSDPEPTPWALPLASPSSSSCFWKLQKPLGPILGSEKAGGEGGYVLPGLVQGCGLGRTREHE